MIPALSAVGDVPGASARTARVRGWPLPGLVVVLVGYALTTIPGVRRPGYSVWIDGWLQNGILVLACGLILMRVVLVAQSRWAWASIGSGVGLYAIGNIIYFAHVQYLDPLPTPSPADVPWLLSYVLLFLGVVSLIRRRVSMPERTVLLDGAVAVLGLSAIAMIWLQVALHGTQGGRLVEVAVTMAYPVCDLVLLALIVGTCVLLGRRPDRSFTYLGVGLALFAAADTIYTVRVATNSYTAGTPLDPMWAVAAVFISAAALRPPAARAARPYGWSTLVVPALFMVTSLIVLIAGGVSRIPVASVALAGATLLMGLARAALTFGDVQRLAVSRAQARTDELTGLSNRRHFNEAVQAAIDGLTGGRRLAVLLLDLDRFKEVNDALGHTVGDRLLTQVGERLSSQMRHSDRLARLGGDEFAILLADTTADEAHAVAERIRKDLQLVFTIDDVPIFVDATVGIAICPDVGTTVEGLLQRADIAMYDAKVDRLGTRVYQAAGTDDLTERLRFVQQLRDGIGEGQLVLHYQPKVDLGTGAVCGVEALVRWDHPERGLLAPDMFLPQAERHGLMRRLTTVVLATALDQIAVWREDGINTRVAVNVCASSLIDTELPVQIADMLAVRGLPGDLIVIEVTETVLMRDPERAQHILEELRRLGVRTSVDDYGTGYSSLARLRDLPVAELKLDRSFTAALASDARARAIVASTIQLAHSLDLVIVAEGVETSDEARELVRLGCDVGQGYHFARPKDAAQTAELLRGSVALASSIPLQARREASSDPGRGAVRGALTAAQNGEARATGP